MLSMRRGHAAFGIGLEAHLVQLVASHVPVSTSLVARSLRPLAILQVSGLVAVVFRWMMHLLLLNLVALVLATHLVVRRLLVVKSARIG